MLLIVLVCQDHVKHSFDGSIDKVEDELIGPIQMPYSLISKAADMANYDLLKQKKV